MEEFNSRVQVQVSRKIRRAFFKKLIAYITLIFFVTEVIRTTGFNLITLLAHECVVSYDFTSGTSGTKYHVTNRSSYNHNYNIYNFFLMLRKISWVCE